MAEERNLPVLCDGLRLAAGAFVPDDPRGLLVLLHGIPSIAPPAADDLGYPGLARSFAEEGWAAAWADMRSVRGSPGFFSIEGWVRDARAVIDAARSIDDLNSLPLAVIASSAGGAVATEATRRGAPVDALVLLAAPAAWVSFADDPVAAAERITRFAGMTLSPETMTDLDTWAAEFEGVTTERSIAHVKVPILIVHGTADDVVPVDHAQRIADRASNADLRIVEGAGHQLRRDPEVVDLVSRWLDKTLR